MRHRLFALLIHDGPEPLDSLKWALKGLSVDTYSVRTCREVERLLSQTQPQLVFTETSFSDGTWVDIINLAERSEAPVNVIVVGASPDPKLYESVTGRGAFDLIVPPFAQESLGCVVRSAELDARQRREAQARAAAA
jgi:DNA-binding NtrC family response regulator